MSPFAYSNKANSPAAQALDNKDSPSVVRASYLLSFILDAGECAVLQVLSPFVHIHLKLVFYRRSADTALCIAISSIHLAVSEVHLEVIKHSEKVLLCMQTIECVSVHIPVLLSLAAKHIETLIEDILLNLTSTRHMLFYNQFVVIRANVQFVCFF